MSDRLAELERRIEQRSAVLAVVGLGYVGLPVACLFAEAGFSVIGLDVKPERIELIGRGISPMDSAEPGLEPMLANVTRQGRLRATTEYGALNAADVILVSVETPVGEDHRPHYDALQSVLRELGPLLRSGALVIVESTIAPGTMDALVRPLLEASSRQVAGEGFFLGHCPERVMPGRLISNLRSVPRVVGGMTPVVAQTMCSLYKTVVHADLDPTDLLTAEFVKTTENAYRDVNIAFANEVALIAEGAGADVWRIRELVNKSPGRAMLLPGAGVGGHCIPKDPWLLVAALSENHTATLIPAARAVNDGMPAEVARLVREALSDARVEPVGARVVVLGYAYLEDSDDARNSPSEALVPLLQQLGCEVVVHDPFVGAFSGPVEQTLALADCAVVMVAHSAYRELNLRQVATTMRQALIVDARRLFDPARLAEAGISVRTLGVGSKRAGADKAGS